MASHSRLIVCAALLLFAAWCRAQSLPSISYGGASGTLTQAPINNIGAGFRTWSANSSVAGEVLVADKVRAAVGASNFDIYATRAIPWAGVARGAARALPYIGTGLLIWSVFDSVRCYAGAAGTLGGLLKCDPGQAPGTVDSICYRASGANLSTPCHPSAGEALAYLYTDVSYSLVEDRGTVLIYGTYRASDGHFIGNVSVNRIHADVSQCPAYTDGYGVLHPPGGAVGADGKCPTGGYIQLSPDDAAQKVEAISARKPDAVQMAQDAASAGVSLDPYAVAKPLTGPVAVQDPAKSTTVTAPNGTPATTTTQATYNITYGNNYFSWTTTQTTSAPDGTTTTETETPTEDKDQCEKHPDIVACQKPDVPDVSDVQTKDIPVTWAPDAGWGADNASCPAAPTVSVLGQSIAIDNTLFCTFFGGIRFVVIGIAAVVGAFIFIGGVKQ